MYKAALLGRDIGYTRSPQLHCAIAKELGIELSFDAVDVKYDGLESAVQRLLREYDGFYITKPYKRDIARMLDGDPTDSINLVRCRDAATFNTDGIGFVRALDRNFNGWRDEVDSALVLGAGGSAHSVTKALINAGKKVYVLNRTLIRAVKMCGALGAELYVNQPAQLVVNCTTAGANGEDALKSLCVLPDFEYAFDLIYSPSDTPFLRRCKSGGARTANGEDMLIYQAIEGDRILFDLDFDVEDMFEAVASNGLYGGENL